jgi:hypothetical protein
MESIKTTARKAGFLYLLQIPLGVFGIIYAPKILIVNGNMAKSISNILANEFTFRLSIVSAILCALVTIGTGYYIFKVLQIVNKNYAKMIVIFTMIVAPITMINELNHIAILILLKSKELNASFSTAQVEVLVNLFLDLHKNGMQIANIFFGLWLLPMGYLVIKSTYIPKVIGFFLIITCIGYLLDFLIFYLKPDFGVTISEYTWLGELLMVLWLLIKGVNLEAYHKFKKQILRS